MLGIYKREINSSTWIPELRMDNLDLNLELLTDDEVEEERLEDDDVGHQQGLPQFGISQERLDANYRQLGSPSPLEESPIRLPELRAKYPQVVCCICLNLIRSHENCLMSNSG